LRTVIGTRMLCISCCLSRGHAWIIQTVRYGGQEGTAVLGRGGISPLDASLWGIQVAFRRERISVVGQYSKGWAEEDILRGGLKNCTSRGWP
jgi:hypothetical protein